MAPARTPMIDRFVQKYDIASDGCWNWTGGKNPNGYGVIWSAEAGNVRLAHRISYELAVGPIDEGMNVCHACDNPACVNPDHLFLGTQRDNLLDMAAKGRASQHTRPQGERHKHAKLTEDDVRAIRRRAREGEVKRRLAEEYGVTPGLIGHITNGRAWTHVED